MGNSTFTVLCFLFNHPPSHLSLPFFKFFFVFINVNKNKALICSALSFKVSFPCKQQVACLDVPEIFRPDYFVLQVPALEEQQFNVRKACCGI